MKLMVLDKLQFEEFAENHPYGNFLQSSKMESAYQLNNWKVTYLGLVESEQIEAATLLLSMESRIGKNYFYAPRGLLVDYSNKPLLSTFISELKKYIKANNGYVLKFDPIVPRFERDIDGNKVEKGFNNEWIVKTLGSLGCRHYGYTRGTDVSKQVNWVFELDIKNKTSEDIFKNFKPNVRNNIKKVQKYGIKIEELPYENLDLFKKITQDTSDRIGFADKPLEYYQEMYKNFKPDDQVKFLLAKINLNDYLATLNDELQQNKQKLEETPDKFSKRGVREQLSKDIDALNKRISETENLKKTDGEELILSGAMFMLYGGEVTYLFSGNYDKYMNFNAQYAIQWYMIQEAVNKNMFKYNFYGISGIFDRKDPDYGVYEFKRGFNGYAVEYIGEFDLVVDRLVYSILNLKKIFHK